MRACFRVPLRAAGEIRSSRWGQFRYLTSAVPVSSRATLYVQGHGTFGALGTGDLSDRENYSEVQLPGGIAPKAVSAGYGHSGVVSECGKLFLMGIPVEFRRLIRMSSIRDTNKLFASLVAKGFMMMGGDCLIEPTLLCEDADVVSCSGCLTVVQKKDGSVWCYGYNPYGQCGVDPEQTESKIGKETVEYMNHVANLPPSKMIDTGLQHVISLSRDGEVFTWGKGGNGQLGNSEASYSYNPVRVDIQNKCVKVAAGFAHSSAICEEGKFYIWGKGCSDKKIDEKEQAKYTVLRYQDKLVPRVLKLPGKRKAIDLVTSYYSTVVVADDMTVWAMGLGEIDRKPLFDLTQVENETGTQGFLRLAPGYKLAKGGKRVTIVGTVKGVEPIDIVLHEQEAFSRKSSLKFDDDSLVTDSNIMQMSGSVNHSLLIGLK